MYFVYRDGKYIDVAGAFRDYWPQPLAGWRASCPAKAIGSII